LIWKSLNFETFLPLKKNAFLLVHMLGSVCLYVTVCSKMIK